MSAQNKNLNPLLARLEALPHDTDREAALFVLEVLPESGWPDFPAKKELVKKLEERKNDNIKRNIAH